MTFNFSWFLSFAASTPYELIVTDDFNIHLNNPTHHLAFQLLSLLPSFNLTQHGVLRPRLRSVWEFGASQLISMGFTSCQRYCTAF